jgi:hypothetical protein
LVASSRKSRVRRWPVVKDRGVSRTGDGDKVGKGEGRGGDVEAKEGVVVKKERVGAWLYRP